MPAIKISPLIIPGPDVTIGYSGGMALYVAHWESVLCLYEFTNVPCLAFATISNTPLN